MALPMFDQNDPRYQQLLAQMARSGNIKPTTMESQVEGILNPSGMAASGYAKDAPAPDPQGSIEGRQRISDSQRKYAQSLRGGAAPKGMTAGPLNVYYGPNIGESLGYAGKQLMGGYMEGQANKKDASIDESRQLEKALALKKVDEQQAFDNKYKTDTLGEAVRGNLVSEGQGAATLTLAQQAAAAEAKQLKVAQELAQAKQDFTEAEGDLVGWQNIENPEDIVYKFEDKKGTPWNKDGETLTSPFDTTGYMKFDSGTGGTTASAATLSEKLDIEGYKQTGRIELEGVKAEDREKLAVLNNDLAQGREISKEDREWKRGMDARFRNGLLAAEEAVRTAPTEISQISEVLGNDLLGELVGRTNPERLKVLAGRGQNVAALSTLDMRIKNVAQTPILAYLEKVRPATEGEYRIAKSNTPTADDLPLVHVEYHAGNTYQDLRDAHDWRVKQADRVSPEKGAEARLQRETDLDMLAGSIAQAAVKWDLPPSTLTTYGFPADLVQYVKERQKEEAGGQ